MCSWCQPSPEGRGWPAASAFTSRSGPGEGSLAGSALLCSFTELVELPSLEWVQPEQGRLTSEFGLNQADGPGCDVSPPWGSKRGSVGPALLPCGFSSGADLHSLAMVQRERVFRHECSATNTPMRPNDCQFAPGFESANLRKNRRPQRRRYACFSTSSWPCSINQVSDSHTPSSEL